MVTLGSSLPEDSEGVFAGTPYRLVRELGRGDTSAVYLVQHRAMGARQVAKVLLPELCGDERSLGRLRSEALSLGRVDHPNVVPIDGAGTTADGRPFLVFQYLKGRPLSEILHSSTLPPGDVVSLGRDVLSGLAAAHESGVLHRHICPSNLLLEVTPAGQQRVVLLDFGWAKFALGWADVPDGEPTLTSSGAVLGEWGYRSPEVEEGGAWIQADDVYSVAAVLYECLTGRRFAPSVGGPVRGHLRRNLVADMSPFLPLFETAFAPIASERFRSAAELMAALEALKLDPTPAVATRRARPRTRRTLDLAVAFFLALALGVATVFLLRAL